jgi:hypothetical protein
MADIIEVLSNMVGDIINAIPAILAAIIVILIGYGSEYSSAKLRTESSRN